MAQQFYIAVDGEKTGPFSIDELKGKGIQHDTLIWTEGYSNWTKAKEIPLLNDILKSSPPPLTKEVEKKSFSTEKVPPIISVDVNAPAKQNWFSMVISYYVKVLKNYVNFKGRARRSEYWYFFLVNLIVSTILMAIGNANNDLTIYGIYAFAIFLPSLAVAVRRMHDTNRSGWYVLIPIYNFILAITEGTQGENEYGADPKSGE